LRSNGLFPAPDAPEEPDRQEQHEDRDHGEDDREKAHPAATAEDGAFRSESSGVRVPSITAILRHAKIARPP